VQSALAFGADYGGSLQAAKTPLSPRSDKLDYGYTRRTWVTLDFRSRVAHEALAQTWKQWKW
jgi:hypothetical protein